MQESINILNELRESGADVLMDIGNKSPYSVPEDYFDSLASQVLAAIFLKSLPSENPYSVPSGYFEHLPGIILEKVNLYKNLPLPASKEKHLYSVPQGFFDGFADTVLEKITSSAGINVQEELEELSPLLSRIPKTNVYSVPDNYFEQINALSTVEENTRTAAKVVSLSTGRVRRWINYAAAACIAAILFGGGYVYISHNSSVKADSTIASASDTDLQKDISDLSDEEIQNYLNSTSSMAVYTNMGLDEDQQPQSIDIQNLLQNMSDEEIQQYLNQHDDAEASKEGI